MVKKEKVDVIQNQEKQERVEKDESIVWQRKAESIIKQWSDIDQKCAVKNNIIIKQFKELLQSYKG